MSTDTPEQVVTEISPQEKRRRQLKRLMKQGKISRYLLAKNKDGTPETCKHRKFDKQIRTWRQVDAMSILMRD